MRQETLYAYFKEHPGIRYKVKELVEIFDGSKSSMCNCVLKLRRSGMIKYEDMYLKHGNKLHFEYWYEEKQDERQFI